VSTCTTAAEVWKVIQDMTASQSRGRVINTRMALATAQKGSSNIADFFSKMKSLADDMAAAGKKLEDEELASYILAGLDEDYNPIVSSVSARVEPLTLGELYTQLISWEQRINLLHGSSGPSLANAATHGGRGGFSRGGGRGRGRGRGCGNGNNSNNSNNFGGRHQQNNTDRPTYQLCRKEGHTVLRCFKRFDTN